MKIFTKIIKIVPLFLLIFILAGTSKAQEKTIIHVFHLVTCGHCKSEIEFLKEYAGKNKDIEIRTYELSGSKANTELLKYIGNELDLEITGVPFTVIGANPITGYSQKYQELIINYINSFDPNVDEDLVVNVIDNYNISPDAEVISYEKLNDNNSRDENNNNNNEQEIDSQKSIEITLPLIGTIDVTKFSLPVLTFVIALADGFNPCAMWTLLFLISLLLGMEDKLKMWTLGIAFIIASGAVYFVFLAAWLNFFLVVEHITIIRYIIGIAALVIGGYYLYDYIKNKDEGCKVMRSEKRQKIFVKLKKITQNRSFLLSLLGIILLAFAVNMVELLCSAGLPAIYTNVLAMNALATWKYYSYLFFYIVIFMLDDIVVFAIAMITLRAVGIEGKYAKLSHLVGGIIVVVIGILLIVNPAILALS